MRVAKLVSAPADTSTRGRDRAQPGSVTQRIARLPPVSAEETTEMFAFMEAADESKRQHGAAVTIEAVMKTARAEAAK